VKKRGLGVLDLGEGRSIISAGVDSKLFSVVQLCDVNETLGQELCRELNPDCFTTSPVLAELLVGECLEPVGYGLLQFLFPVGIQGGAERLKQRLVFGSGAYPVCTLAN